LRDVLWTELAKWRRESEAVSAQRGDHPALYLSALFSLMQDRVVDVGAPDWGAFGRTARKENPEALQGFHGQYLLYVIDEASGVEEAIYEAAEGALSTPEGRVLMLGNPTRTSGTFYASHHKDRGSYTTLHFRSDESPLVDPGYRPRLVTKWGEGSNVVRVRCDGLFPRAEDDVLISVDLTEPCLSRDPEPGTGARILGVDPARMGSDRTVLLLRQGRVVEQIKVYAKHDLMEVVGFVVAVLDVWRVDSVRVDLVGLGSGVHDRLAELRRHGRIRPAIEGVDVAAAAPLKATQDDMQAHRPRDYLWLQTAIWLRDAEPIFAAEDRQACEDLAGELTAVHYAFTSDGALKLESKDEMRKRLGHSPDLADALCLTHAPSAGLPPIDLSLTLTGLSQRPIAHRTSLPRRPGPTPTGHEPVESRVARLWNANEVDDDYL
jgi:hypothetical protein